MLTFLACCEQKSEMFSSMKFSGFWTRFWGDGMSICIITKLLPFFMKQLFTLSVRSARWFSPLLASFSVEMNYYRKFSFIRQ